MSESDIEPLHLTTEAAAPARRGPKRPIKPYKPRGRRAASLLDSLTEPKPEIAPTLRGDAATSPEQKLAERSASARRRPMSVPRLRLEVPEIPGFHLHWFADRPGRITLALDGSYEFVSNDEAIVNNFSLASDTLSGNSDLGSRISVVSGGERLYLMKIKQELYEQDQAEGQKKPDRVDEAIRRGHLMSADKLSPADRMNTYVRQKYEQSINPINRRP